MGFSTNCCWVHKWSSRIYKKTMVLYLYVETLDGNTIPIVRENMIFTFAARMIGLLAVFVIVFSPPYMMLATFIALLSVFIVKCMKTPPKHQQSNETRERQGKPTQKRWIVIWNWLWISELMVCIAITNTKESFKPEMTSLSSILLASYHHYHHNHAIASKPISSLVCVAIGCWTIYSTLRITQHHTHTHKAEKRENYCVKTMPFTYAFSCLLLPLVSAKV